MTQTPKEFSYGDLTTLHKKLRIKYGNANHCDFCNLNINKRFEWALLKGHKYSSNKEDYIQLCPSCHRKYDKCFGHIGDIVRGKPANNIKKIISSDGQVFDSITLASKKIGIARTTISNCLSGKSKTAGGLKWEYL